jgi:hypothetical protein
LQQAKLYDGQAFVGLLGDGIARHRCAAGIAEQKNLLIPQIDQSAKRFMPLFPPSAAHGFDSSIDDLLFAGVRHWISGRKLGLVDGEIAACATNHIKDGSGVNELEAVAKSIPFANHGKNDHRSGGKHEVQLQNLAQRHLKRQYRRDPGFANVNGIALQPTNRPRMYRDIDCEFEPGMAAGLDAVRTHRAKVLLIICA